jgi:hypothetical protein
MTIWRTALLAGPGLAIVLGLAGMFVAASRRARHGSVRVDERDLVMTRDDGERRIPLASVRSGVVVPDAFGAAARVELALASGDQLFADVAGVAEGERLLAAAGIDAAQRRCTVPLVAPARAALRRGVAIAGAILFMFMALGFLLQAIGPISNAFVPVWLFSTTAAAVLAARAARPKSITVGADGLAIGGAFRDRFVPFADIADVRAEGATILIALRKRVDPLAIRCDREAARSIALRVKEAMAARSSSPAARLELLDRSGRSIAAWRDAAARLVERAGDYRAAGFSDDDLVAILSSSDASAERRVGAALALAAGDDAQRERVRAAADACASPRMRVALTRIAGGDAEDQAVEEALAAEPEEAAHAAR